MAVILHRVSLGLPAASQLPGRVPTDVDDALHLHLNVSIVNHEKDHNSSVKEGIMPTAKKFS